jgi:hypothetical protein
VGLVTDLPAVADAACRVRTADVTTSRQVKGAAARAVAQRAPPSLRPILPLSSKPYRRAALAAYGRSRAEPSRHSYGDRCRRMARCASAASLGAARRVWDARRGVESGSSDMNAFRLNPPQMTAAEFTAALNRHGFRVVGTKIEDATGRCPGVRWAAVLRGSVVDRNRTLDKVVRERDAEIARREKPD